MTHPFQPFTPEHFVTLAVGAAVGAAFILAGNRGGAKQVTATRLLAGINLAVCPLSIVAWIAADIPKSIDNYLPLQMCDLAAIAGGISLLADRPILRAVTYFWGLAATFQALLTPAIRVGFPAPVYLLFFVQHFAVVIAALYLPIVLGWRPKRPWWRSPLEMFGISVVYLVFVLAINGWLGSNFAFVSHPPENPSLIDYLGPWPWYILPLLGIALMLFFLLMLPFSGRRTKV